MTERYTRTAIVLHWLIAIGVIANVALAWIWPLVADDQVRPLIDKHKAVGITVLGLAILRVLWRIAHKPPVLPTAYAPWETKTAHVVHWGLYFLIFAMPLTGWIMDSAYKDAATHPMPFFGLFEWPRIAAVQHLPSATRDQVHEIFEGAHGVLAKFVYLLVALHVAGALKHQFQGHKELQRMGIGRP